jgi:hypothetical protein
MRPAAIARLMRSAVWPGWPPGPGTGRGLPSWTRPPGRSGLRLFGEIQALGYDGSYPVVRDYLARNRPAREPLPPAPPTVRDVTNWLCRRPDTLTEDDKPRLQAILGRCPEVQAASDQVRSFAAMITDLNSQDLPQWMAAARDAELPGIASFAKGLEQDLDAVTSGLTMNWNSGPVDHIKMLSSSRGRFSPRLSRNRT